MTYGQLRLACTQENPGIPLELLDGWIQDRYTEILDSIAWKRQEAESVIQAPASYQTGTLTCTEGQATVLGAGTTFTPEMAGRMIRIDRQSEFYQFTFVDASSGWLDRGWEHPSTTVSTFRIDQAIFLLPGDCRILNGVHGLHDWETAMERVTPGELNRRAGQRQSYGTPTMYAPTWDNFADPPNMQVELYPIPESPSSSSDDLSYVVDYVFEQPALTPGATSASLLPWVRPAALKAGVKASNLLRAKDWSGADKMQKEMDRLVGLMAKINALQIGPEPIRLAPEFTRRGTVGSNWPVNRRWDGE